MNDDTQITVTYCGPQPRPVHEEEFDPQAGERYRSLRDEFRERFADLLDNPDNLFRSEHE